jgi:hypothetical protein
VHKRVKVVYGMGYTVLHMPKTITDIIPPSRRKAMQADRPMDVVPPTPVPPILNDSDDDGEEYGDEPRYPRPMRSHKRGFPWKYAIAALIVLAGALVVLHAFGGAKVQVSPAVKETTVSGEFSATGSAGDLPFELITASTVANESVPAEGTKEASDPAQGTITVYNAQSKPQQLIKNTRFETPAGLIFRIRDSISVPAGSATTPGTLSVTVYADEGGEKYNVGPTSFTIPGLKGSETYDMVYARSTEAMVGGYAGMRATVSEGTRTTRYEAMKPLIDSELSTALSAEIPEGYVLLPGAIWTTYEAQPDGVASGTVTLNQKGSATAVVLPAKALGKAIASRTMNPSYKGEDIVVNDIGTLTLASMTGAPPASGDTTFTFTLSGSTNLKWVADAKKIAGAVAGKSRDAAQTLLKGFPEVERAVIVLRPFWAGSFPSDPEKIEVVIEGEEKK